MSAAVRNARREAAKLEHKQAWASSRRTSLEPMQLAFELGWPPSVNHYFVERAVVSKKTGKAIVLKHPGSDGIAYRAQVSKHLLVQRVPRNQLTGKLGVLIVAHPPDRRARDLDNLLKATLDGLKHAGLYRDDADIDDLHIIRGTVKAGGELSLIVEEIAGPATVSMPLPLRDPIHDEALRIMGART